MHESSPQPNPEIGPWHPTSSAPPSTAERRFYCALYWPPWSPREPVIHKLFGTRCLGRSSSGWLGVNYPHLPRCRRRRNFSFSLILKYHLWQGNPVDSDKGPPVRTTTKESASNTDLQRHRPRPHGPTASGGLVPGRDERWKAREACGERRTGACASLDTAGGAGR